MAGMGWTFHPQKKLNWFMSSAKWVQKRQPPDNTEKKPNSEHARRKIEIWKKSVGCSQLVADFLARSKNSTVLRRSMLINYILIWMKSATVDLGHMCFTTNISSSIIWYTNREEKQRGNSAIGWKGKIQTRFRARPFFCTFWVSKVVNNKLQSKWK